jgi:NAD(P)-dependent dehydrogenase (short-subunit alcohol dehydrogenase family)
MRQYVIIGGSSGIGKSISSLLKEHGKVTATYFQNTDELDKDIDWHYFDALAPNFDWLPAEIDGLVYCPGTINLKPFKRIDRKSLVDDFNLQVGGAFETIQQSLPALKKSKSGSILLFSTVAVQNGFNFHSMVSTSKGGIEGLTLALAAELAPLIRVNAIAPSLTATNLSSKMLNSETKIEQNNNRHPLKRIGQADDIANMAELLLSEKGSWITGQIIKVDGGMSSIKS